MSSAESEPVLELDPKVKTVPEPSTQWPELDDAMMAQPQSSACQDVRLDSDGDAGSTVNGSKSQIVDDISSSSVKSPRVNHRAVSDISSLTITTDESKDNSFLNPGQHADFGVDNGDADSPKESGDIIRDQQTKKRKCSSNTGHETESVSDDELPDDGKHLDTEAISDGELHTAIISGAESVSEDELPPTKKRKPSRGPETKNASRKKKKLLDFKIVDWDEVLNQVHASKALPELEKYWKVVKDDPSDFTGWTYLLQYVDQENDAKAARLAYDSFLSMYPYCYGYWRKYADYEKRKGNSEECEEVFKRGLRAIPLSVDLWLHYLSYCKTTLQDDEALLRERFEMSIGKCGLEFRSDRLWLSYVQWEMENRRYQRVLSVYDRLLETPMQNLKNHFEDFQDFVNQQRPNKILSVDEFFTVRSYVVSKLKARSVPMDTTSNPPGDGEESSSNCTDEETIYMRERIIALRYKVYKATLSKISDRWAFETSVKRPYFHIKPLEKSQLDNWNKYLDFEILSGDFKRTVVLFERALIACAMYQQFWLKYVRYLEQCNADVRMVRSVYKRACLVHLAKNSHVALAWATFEESQGNLSLARKIYTNTDVRANKLMLVQLRRIHFERRCKNFDKASQLFENYIATSNQKCATLALISKYAQFCHRTLNEPDKAYKILTESIAKYPDEPRLYYQLNDFVRSTSTGFDQRCIDVCNSVLENRAINLETKLQFAQMKLEYYQDLGGNLLEMINAQTEYLQILQEYREVQAEKYKTEGMYYYSKRQ